MSKKRNLNSPEGFGDFPQNVESLLRSAAPEDLAVDRDAIFFQAGLNAAAKRRATRFVWPTVAAALVFICAGLSVALFREMHTANALQLALTQLKTSERVASSYIDRNDSAVLDDTEAVVSRASNFGELRRDQLRNFRKLASNASLPPGQLTAGGGIENPTDLQSAAITQAALQEVRDRLAPPSSHRSPTFLELRMQEEG